MVRIVDKDTGLKQFKKAIKNFKGKVLKVGIFADSGKGKNGELIVNRALANEYGTSNIPERSFIRSTSDEKNQEWGKSIDKIVDRLLTEEVDVNQYLGLLGEKIVGDIKEKISSNMPPLNSPATIKRKGSNKTLIDTGEMRASIAYKIEN